MAPKKDGAAAAAPNAITGFDARETRFLAAAFLASTGAKVKIDYEVLGHYTGYTKGSANTMWTAVKRKAAELQPPWGPLVGIAGDGDEPKTPSKPKPKPNPSKKRKAADEEDANANDDDAEASGADETVKTEHATKKKKAAPKKKAKKDDGVGE